MIRPKSDWPKKLDSKWKSCYWCDPKWFRAVLQFDSGSVEPTEDETLTGATSGDSGVVTDSYLYSGTYAGGDAVGWVEMSTLSGQDAEQGTIFQDDENINGSTGGSNMLTANGVGAYQQYGIIYPDKDMIKYRGRWYCRWHFDWYNKRAVWDLENRINVAELEKDRGKE